MKAHSELRKLVALLLTTSALFALCWFSGPYFVSKFAPGSQTSTVNSVGQVYLACFQMANDGRGNKDPELGWPGELARGPHPVRTFSDLMNRMIEYDYLKVSDVVKCTASRFSPGWTPEQHGSPLRTFFKVYRVTEQDGPNVIMFASRNFTYGQDLDPAGPYGTRGFIIVRKGGDGAAYKPEQVRHLEKLGLLPGRKDFEDRPVETTEDTLESR